MAREEVAGIKGLWRGDKLQVRVVPGTDSQDWTGPDTFIIQVARAQKSSRHGWYIVSTTPVGPDAETLFYLDDGWDIRTDEGLRVVE